MFHNFSFSFRIIRFWFYSLAILSSINILLAEENEDEDEFQETEEEAYGPLQIKSQTQLCSADYYIQKKNDKEKDRKRKNIGIGEQITFLLIGKPKGEVEKLTWNIQGEGFESSDTDQFEGAQKITLNAKKNLLKDTSVKIIAETSEGKQASITINIKIPKKMTGKKFQGKIELGNGLSAHTDDFKFSKGEHGLLGFIEVTLSPTDVSFKKIKIIERDGGLMWEGKNDTPPKPKPELAEDHKTCGFSAPIQDKNNFYDMVGDNRDIKEILNTIFVSKHNPQKFWFICDLYVHLGNGGPGSEKEDSIFLGKENGTLHIEAIDKFTTKTIAKKFGIKFERISNEG